ncbi:TPA: hypothetical protein ACH3X1_001545 [Trebouxia sp. C0004]
MVSLVQNWIGNRSSAEQLAKVYEQQEQAKYLRHRKVYTEVQTAKQQGSVGQPSMEAYLENPSQRLADPFPSYSSIHPDHMNNDHMNNEVPSYCGFHASGKWIVSIIQAVALIHKKYDVLHMQSQSARVLSNDVCPALAGASKDQSTKTVAGIIMFYADNIRSAKNKMAAAISTLGHGLASLSSRFIDSGMRQDVFHLLQRCGKALNWSSGLIQAANQVQLRTVSEQTSLLQLDTPGSSSQQRPASTARAAASQGFPPAVLLGNSRQRSGTTRVPAAAQSAASPSRWGGGWPSSRLA